MKWKNENDLRMEWQRKFATEFQRVVRASMGYTSQHVLNHMTGTAIEAWQHDWKNTSPETAAQLYWKEYAEKD